MGDGRLELTTGRIAERQTPFKPVGDFTQSLDINTGRMVGDKKLEMFLKRHKTYFR